MNYELRSTKKKKRKGFTLIEVLLAIFVLEIGLLGIAGFYTYGFKVTRYARNETIAANLASGFLDEQLALAYENIPLGSTTDENNPFDNWDKKIEVAYINVDNWQLSDLDTHMKKITVMVFWQEEGQEKSFQIASIKAEH